MMTGSAIAAAAMAPASALVPGAAALGLGGLGGAGGARGDGGGAPWPTTLTVIRWPRSQWPVTPLMK